MTFKPTAQQDAILTALTGTRDHLAIVARAGCGKTSTILLCVDAIRKTEPFAEVAVVAYNKAIADEVGAKLKAAGHDDWRLTQAATAHSLGFSLLKYAYRSQVDDKKVMILIEAQMTPEVITPWSTFRSQIAQLVRYGKQAAIGFFRPVEDIAAWQELIDHYGLELEETTDASEVIRCAQHIYRLSLQDVERVDFDDMILLPLVKQLRVRFGKDYLFVDEAQDLSAARQALIRKFLKPSGRIVIVGDDRQAIYGFSGADAEALPNMIRQYDATVLPLSVTWRCPRAVVQLAQSIVPDIEAAEGAPAGSVGFLQADEQLGWVDPTGKTPPLAWEAFQPGRDAILCRNTAPLVSAAFRLIRSGVPAKVEGRQIGEGLLTLARRWKVSTIAALLQRLETYRRREMEKALAKGDDARAEELDDKVQTLVEIAQACQQRGEQQVGDVCAAIDRLFGDNVQGAVTLATYHRSKGREWAHVFLWEHADRCPSRAARQPWQQAQEQNLIYVAFTRAQESLTFLN